MEGKKGNGFDPVDWLDRKTDVLLDFGKKQKAEASKDLIGLTVFGKSYKDFIAKVPPVNDGGLDKYAQLHKLSAKQVLGLRALLAEGLIEGKDELLKEKGLVVNLILGTPQNPQDSESIHFPALVPVIDELRILPKTELPLPKDHDGKAFQHSGRGDISAEKAMIIFGFMWKDLSEEQRVLILEDYVNIGRTMAAKLPENLNQEKALIDNHAYSQILTYDMRQELLPMLDPNESTLREIIDVEIGFARRQ